MDTFYSGSSVLVTGATGFIGKALVEALLRKLAPATIFVLVRPQDGKDAHQRCTEAICKSPIWTWLRRKPPQGCRGVDAFIRSRIVGCWTALGRVLCYPDH